MKNVFRIFILIIGNILLCQCDPEPHKINETLLTVYNNSNDDICVYLTSNYPDTIIPDVKYTWSNGIDHHRTFVHARRSHECTSMEIDREQYFRKNSIFQVFVLLEEYAPLDSYNNLTMADVYKNGWILHRYEFTREQLEQMDWTIVYP